MIPSKFFIAGVSVLMPLGVATAQSPSRVSLLSNTAPLITVAGSDPDAPQYLVPRGTGKDGIGFLFINRSDAPPGFGVACTGSLLADGMDILTAAHCLADETGTLRATDLQSFFLPAGGGGIEAVHAETFHVDPLYTGDVIDEHDIAVVRLAHPISDISGYSLYNHGAVGQTYNVAGFGLLGTGATGDSPVQALRQGYNRFLFSLTDPVFGGGIESLLGQTNINVYMSAFSDGTPATDAACVFTGFFMADNSAYCNIPPVDGEVGTTFGDSGGPAFIDGQIAGVTSFGVALLDTIPGQFGELDGFTRTDINARWIASVTPEPSSVALLAPALLGLSGLSIARRRRHHC